MIRKSERNILSVIHTYGMTMSRSNSFGFLTVVGFAALAGHGAFRCYFPLNQHIGEFLGIYGALCLLSLATALWLQRNTASLAALSPSSRIPVTWLVLGFAASFRLVFLWEPPIFSTDIYRYIWDGRVQSAGINPYVLPPAAPELAFLRNALHSRINFPQLSTIYPPIAEWIFRLAAAVAPTVLAQKAAFVLFDLLTIWVLMKFLSLRGASPAWAVLYAWHPLPVVEFAGSGHLDPLMLFFLVTGLYLLEKGKLDGGSAALAAAAMAKLAPLVMIPWIVTQGRKRASLIYFGILVACAVPFVPGLWAAHRQGLPLFIGARAYASGWLANPSLFAIFGLAVSSASIRKFVLGGVLLFLSAPWALGNKNQPARFALGCLYALLLCSSVVEPWYVLWILPLLCLFPVWSGLAWTWLVGFLYIVLDPRLSAISWHYPAWTWVWVVEYGTVYALLLSELLTWLRGDPRRMKRFSWSRVTNFKEALPNSQGAEKMKRIVGTQARLALTLAIMVMGASFAAAAEGVTVSVSKIKDLNLRIYGFVETDLITDSTLGLTEEAGNAAIARRTDTTKAGSPDTFNGTHHRTMMSVRNSRLGFDLTLPKTEAGLQTEGVIELDFLGNNAPNTPPSAALPTSQSERDFFNNPAVRVRHAYLSLSYDNWNAKVGQYWSLLGWQPYYFPGEVIVQPAVGQAYRRFAQMRVTHTLPFMDAWTLESAADIARPAQVNSAIPLFQGGFRLASTKLKAASLGGAGTSMVGLSAGISGDLIPVRTDAGNQTGEAVAGDVFIPIIPSSDGKDRSNTLSAAGEIMSGRGVGGLEYSNLTSGVGAVSAASGVPTPSGSAIDSGIAGINTSGSVELIRFRAFRAHAQYSLPGGKWSASTGYAQVEARNLNRFALTQAAANPLIPKIQFGYVSLFYDPLGWLRFAGEWNHAVDTYNDPGNRYAINNRFQFSTYFIF